MGCKSLTVLKSFLDGASYALYKLGLDEDDNILNPIPFRFFNDFVANYYDYYESTSGWKSMILKMNKNDEELCFDVFYMLFDKFHSIRIANKYKCILTPEHIEYCHNSTKQMLPPSYIQKEPIFINPKAIFLIELSEDSGCLCMVELLNKIILEMHLFKNRNYAIEHFNTYFGGSFIWIPIESIPEKFEYF